MAEYPHAGGNDGSIKWLFLCENMRESYCFPCIMEVAKREHYYFCFKKSHAVKAE
jgi:hypothetical protein